MSSLSRVLNSYAKDTQARAHDLRPFCDVCGSRVEKMVLSRNVDRSVFVFEAHCHGQVEECELPRNLFLFADKSLQPGKAFVRLRVTEVKRIEPPES